MKEEYVRYKSRDPVTEIKQKTPRLTALGSGRYAHRYSRRGATELAVRQNELTEVGRKIGLRWGE